MESTMSIFVYQWKSRDGHACFLGDEMVEFNLDQPKRIHRSTNGTQQFTQMLHVPHTACHNCRLFPVLHETYSFNIIIFDFQEKLGDCCRGLPRPSTRLGSNTALTFSYLLPLPSSSAEKEMARCSSGCNSPPHPTRIPLFTDEAFP